MAIKTRNKRLLPYLSLVPALLLAGCVDSNGTGIETSPTATTQQEQSNTAPVLSQPDQTVSQTTGVSTADTLLADAPAGSLTATPSEPSNLRGVVYTETEIELFWNRAATGESVIGYQIWRDGEQIFTRDGSSFYENQLQPATTYRYDIIALDDQGRTGPPATLFLTTREFSLTFTNENAMRQLEYLVSIINEEPFAEFVDTAFVVDNFRANNTEEYTTAGFELIDANYANSLTTENYGCVSNNGSMTRGHTDSLQDNRGFGRFSGCSSLLLNGQRLGGEYNRSWTLVRYVYNGGSYRSFDFHPMTITANDGYTRSMVGTVDAFTGDSSYVSWQDTNDSTPFVYTALALEGTTRITDIEMIRRAGVTTEENADPWSRNLLAAFSVQAPATGNKPIVVETSERFITYSHDSCFESGRLRASGTDGSWIEVNADTGDSNTYELTVGVDDSSLSSVHAWSNTTIMKQLTSRLRDVPATLADNCAGLYLPTR